MYALSLSWLVTKCEMLNALFILVDCEQVAKLCLQTINVIYLFIDYQSVHYGMCWPQKNNIHVPLKCSKFCLKHVTFLPCLSV